MKAVNNAVETKRRKRDNSQEIISENPKKAKVHAQRKFAQGAAVNNSVITPIKDKVRPTSATPSSGPMLTSKCPNTEDFLTFLCFRRTSILPAKLDFFKDVVGCEQQLSTVPQKTKFQSGQKNQSDLSSSIGKKQNKKVEKTIENKKSQPPSVQALRKKYEEQRLAKHKVTSVTKLAQKVKGKNMVRTRSSIAVEESKAESKKELHEKEKICGGLRSGLKRSQPNITKTNKKILKQKHLRPGLRSSGLNQRIDKSKPVAKTGAVNVKIIEKENKGSKIDTVQIKTKNMKVKKVEGFSDFSSDDNEPLLAVKNPKITKKISKISEKGSNIEKKVVKTRSQLNESGSAKILARPSRKTKEAAAIYMEMITKKLVSPEKSGDDDVSSIDSFPELPNARRNEQRETEIKNKALSHKKIESTTQLVEVKGKEGIKATKKLEMKKVDNKISKEKTTKKQNQIAKKELKKVKPEIDAMPNKKVNKSFTKENKSVTTVKNEKKGKIKPNFRPSTRSRHQEKLKDALKTIPTKVTSPKMSKATPKAEKQSFEKLTQGNQKGKEKSGSGSGGTENKEGQDSFKNTKKGDEKMPSALNEKSDEKEFAPTVRVSNAKKGKKSKTEEKTVEKVVETKSANEKKERNEIEPVECNIKKRPTRKCSTTDKIWIDIDDFSSDEEDFTDIAKSSKTRASAKKTNPIHSKNKSKIEVKDNINSKESLTEIKIKKLERTAEIKDSSEKEKKTEVKKTKTEKVTKVEEDEKKKPLLKLEKSQSDVKNDERGTNTQVEGSKNIFPQAVLADNKKTYTSPNKSKKIIKKEENVEVKQTKTLESKNKKSQVEESMENQTKNFSPTDKVTDKESVLIVPEKQRSVIDNEGKADKSNEKQKRVTENVLKGSKRNEKQKSVTESATKGDKNIAKETSAEKYSTASREEEVQCKNFKSKKRKLDKSNRPKKNSESAVESSKKTTKRARPVRQCNTGEKKWIETDSDSFSFYESSDEDNLPIFDFKTKGNSDLENNENDMKESKILLDKKTVEVVKQDTNEHKIVEKNKEVESKNNELKEKKIMEEKKDKQVVEEQKKEKNLSTEKHKLNPTPDNFSESDEEPLKKKAVLLEHVNLKVPEIIPGKNEIKTFTKSTRELPDLHPLRKVPSETQLAVKTSPLKAAACVDHSNFTAPALKEPKILMQSPKNVDNKSKILSSNRQKIVETENSTLQGNVFAESKTKHMNLPMPNRMETIVQAQKKDKPSEVNASYSNEVRVTFGNVPYQSIAHSSPINLIPCNYQVQPIINFPREPISTHGLDLLSEVALPTALPEKFNSQTERIEKWLKDSLEVEQKQSFSSQERRNKESLGVNKPIVEKPEINYFREKSIQPTFQISNHMESKQLGHIDLQESQKLLKRNLFALETKYETNRGEQQTGMPKKALTSVQDLLKLQKEKKESAKSSSNNSPHLKNCKCNSCVVKKGWFKNKPVPKTVQQKSWPGESPEESAKPFQSLTKAFTKVFNDPKLSPEKVSVSVAPMVVSSTSTPTITKNVECSSYNNGMEKKRIFQQRKMSFLERMKEREHKEAASQKISPKAFSPNNESSVYAFEPEPEQVMGVNTPFRSKTRESRTSSTSKSDDDTLRICEDESSLSTPTFEMEKPFKENKETIRPMQSTSIAVQVNLDSEAVPEVETVSEIQDGKSIEISTQTEVPEEDSDSPMFYIPLQQGTASVSSDTSDQHLIQGVALKLGTEGPRVIMKAKLLTKPPDAASMKAVVMPQPKRMFDQKNNNPPIGTVQPTTRKPPEEQKSVGSEPLTSQKDVPERTESTPHALTDSGIGSETFATKSRKSSPAISSGRTSKNQKKSKGSKDFKEKVEENNKNSPSSSAASVKSKRPSKQKTSETQINPSNKTWIPPPGITSKLVEAPTFHATEKDFQDPFEFLDRIKPVAEKFGLCRIIPPSNFKPDCKVTDDMRFTAYNQYVHRMFHRWGPNIKEMMAIKKYLATQSISLKQPPWIGGIEVDLPRLYQSVQNCGGLMKVMEKKKWNQVADMMKIPKAAQDRVTKLDDIYCKYLLPYDTLSPDERQKLFDEVEKDWLERQQSSTESSESQVEEEADEENYIEECEECVVKGKNMALNQFYRIARNTMSMWFKNPEPPPREVENEFWKHVSERNHHVCVHSGSIDSSGWGYGFPIGKNNSFSKHPWNLKVLTNNSATVLRSLGPVMGVTVPTLHVGMVFTAFCWYRDPHGLPWIEYLHTGAPKIWYGISDDNSKVFQEALTKLLPRYIKNKTIWLPSDTAMVPPSLLVENGVSLCHTVQEPGQFILVFPRAFTSSICTGYLVSESVYFAQSSWLATAEQAFKDIQESCEPSMFSLEKLLFSIATDSRSNIETLKQVLPMIWHIRQKEVDERKTLSNLGLKTSERLPSREIGNKKRKGRWVQEDDGDFECEICRTNLYVSLVTNSQEEGVYCLPHAIELLTQKRHQLKYCKLMYNYSQEEMNDLIEKLEQRIENKSSKKVPSKSSGTGK